MPQIRPITDLRNTNEISGPVSCEKRANFHHQKRLWRFGSDEYIATELGVEQSALNLIDKLEEAILSLEAMPHRGTRRRLGAFARKGYRQLFVTNFTIVYRIDEMKKQVIIVTADIQEVSLKA